MKKRESKPRYIDLFAGCGGLSLGLHLAGWQGLFAIEKSPFAFDTLRHNLMYNKQHFAWPSWLECSEHDIDAVLANHHKQLESLAGTIDLVAGGPPCQGFSIAGKRVENDVRNKLVYSYIDFIKLIKPRLILFENVKGFTYPFKGKDDKTTPIPYSQIVKQELENINYHMKPYLIDFQNYGVPQRRERFILVGSLNNDAAAVFISKIEEKKSMFLKKKGLNTLTTVEDAISDLLKSNGEKPTPDREGFISGLYSESKSKYQDVMRKGYGRKKAIPDSHSFAKHGESIDKLFTRLLEEYQKRGKKIKNKEREVWGIKKRGLTILAADQVAPTLTTHPDDFVHYCEPRILTVREYARLQTFPDWYEIRQKYTTGGHLRKTEVPRYTQIGNAIPPLFAELAGIVLKKMVENE